MDYNVMLIVSLAFTVQCVSGMFSEKACLYINDLISSCISKQGNVCVSNNHCYYMIYLRCRISRSYVSTYIS